MSVAARAHLSTTGEECCDGCGVVDICLTALIHAEADIILIDSLRNGIGCRYEN